MELVSTNNWPIIKCVGDSGVNCPWHQEWKKSSKFIGISPLVIKIKPKYLEQWFLFKVFKREGLTTTIGMTKQDMNDYTKFHPNLYTSSKSWRSRPIFMFLRNTSGNFIHEIIEESQMFNVLESQFTSAFGVQAKLWVLQKNQTPPPRVVSAASGCYPTTVCTMACIIDLQLCRLRLCCSRIASIVALLDFPCCFVFTVNVHALRFWRSTYGFPRCLFWFRTEEFLHWRVCLRAC